MARRTTEDLEYRKETRRGRGRSKRKWFLLAGLALLIALLPRLLTVRPVFQTLVDRFAGIHPMRAEFGAVKAGWFTPVSARDIRLVDGDGQVLASIAQVSTSKGLVSWISQSQDLGTITVEGVEAQVVAAEGTTNLEQALAPWLVTDSEQTLEEPASTSPTIRGTLQVLDSRLTLRELGRPEEWLVEIPKVTLALPEAGQLTGPIEVQALIGDVSGTVPNSQGSIAANVKQSSGEAFEVRASMEHVPLDFWHIVHARLPEIPVQQLKGRVSAVLAGNIADANAWSFVVNGLQASELSMVAPELVGDQPATLDAITGSTACSLANGLLRLDKMRLVCDFADTQATAQIPWPLQLPTVGRPYVPGAVFAAQGALDLPKLAKAAETLIPLRENMQLMAGTARFSLKQSLNQEGQADCSANLQLSDLQALSGGQPLNWQDPLSIELAARERAAGTELEAAVAAEFASLKAGGSIQAGQLTADVNLSQLRQRLQQWVELPITTLEGTANANMNWHLEGNDQVVASGKLATTPIRIVTTTGNQLSETDWSGEFSGQMTLAAGSPHSIDQASIALRSQDEQLVVNLMRPLYLLPGSEAESHPPATFSMDVHANLANCSRRGSVWLSEPPAMELEGNLQLAASGLVDTTHVELLNANWNGQPIEIRTPQMVIREPRVVGKFKGRIDSNDLTRTVVDTLELTSSSVSLLAQDQANPDGGGSRVGRAKFLADVGRLMNTATAALPTQPTAQPAEALSRILASGRCDGELSWQVSSQSAGLNLLVNASNLSVASQAVGQTEPTTLWQEPQASTQLLASWQAETGAVDVQKFTVNMPWFEYAGTANYQADDTQQSARLEGQANYDAGQLAHKLTPFTGGQLQLAGQQSMPVRVDWMAANDSTQSLFSGLQAKTSVGWEQAAVAGVLVGKANVPIVVDNGVLRTVAEIPVSGGMLRWDLESDLTADELRLRQQPMMLLENVAITEEMCKGWLKYVAPLVAEATSVDGRMSLYVDQAELSPANPINQTVKGQLTVHSATVGPGPLSNQIVALVEQVEAIRKQQFAQQVSSTQRVWMNVPEQRIDFEMVDGRVTHRNLQVTIGDATIHSHGSVGVNGDLNMVAAMPIPDDWADKSRWLAGFRGQSLQFPVGGTFRQPRLDTQLLSQVGRQAVEQAASGFLQQNLNRGLEKLLGEPRNAPAAPTGQKPAENPMLDIGGQILRTPGLNLPELFGGSRSTPAPNQPPSQPPQQP